MRLGKVGYTYVGQATTFISLVGVLLAAWALFSNRLAYRTRLAQVAAEMVAGNAALHLRDEAAICRQGWTVDIRRYPLIDNSETVKFDCETLRPVIEAMSGHFAIARLQVLPAGELCRPAMAYGAAHHAFHSAGPSHC